MSGEIIAIVTVGVTLAGLLVGLFAWMRQDIKQVESQIGELRERVDAQIGELRERMAHLEGLLEGIRDFVTGRTPAR